MYSQILKRPVYTIEYAKYADESPMNLNERVNDHFVARHGGKLKF